VIFEDNGGAPLVLTGATTQFSTITANESVNVTGFGTIGTGGTVATITVATGKNLYFGNQGFPTATGTGLIKNGEGILTIAGGTYAGGFTLNVGTVALSGINGMGGGTNNALIINGGTIRSCDTGARNLSDKYSGGITVGGDFTLGGSGLPESARASGPWAFGTGAGQAYGYSPQIPPRKLMSA
jgi:autotransporter-associated beta strand protein